MIAPQQQHLLRIPSTGFAVLGYSRRLPGSSSLATKEIAFRCCVLGDVKAGAVEWSSSESQITAMPAVDEGGKRKWRTFTICTSKLERENEISRKTMIIEFYFKSCRIYSNIGKVQPGPAASLTLSQISNCGCLDDLFVIVLARRGRFD
jgi:hypothetical protein